MQDKNTSFSKNLSHSTGVSKKIWLIATLLIGSFCLAYLLPAAQTGEPVNIPTAIGAPTNTDEAVETPISPQVYREYRVAGDAPRYLTISKLNVRARVLGVGLASHKTIGAPKSIHDAGWYTSSAKPGQAGVMFIDGHVSGPNAPGIFKKIGTLAANDIVEVERGDGAVLRYGVETVKSAPETTINMNQLLVSPDVDGQHLVLMTCGGRFDRAQDKYVDRVIVQARRIF